MDKNEEKKSNSGIILGVIIILLLLIFAIWFFLIRDKNPNNNGNENGNSGNGNTSNKQGYEYDYRDGALIQVVDENGKPKQEYFVINGVILIGNRHNYDDRDDTVEIIKYFADKGYLKEGINSSFYLNEYIGVYMDTNYNGEEGDVRILVVPHKTIEEHEKDDLELVASEKGAIMNYVKPDEDNYKYVNEGYVSMDYPEGKYDILFTYKGKIAYFINVNLTKEVNE